MQKKSISTLIATLTLASAVALVAETKVEAQAARNAGDFEQQVRAYILDHPEVLIQSLQQFQVKQKAAKEQKAREALAEKADALQHDSSSPFVGNKDGITVVEFFDYRCGYCKKVQPVIAKLLESNPNVRVVYKEFPILGPDSMVASRAALAALKQGGYEKLHDALIATNESITIDVVKKLAAEQGLDAAKLEADMKSPEVDEAIVRNRDLGEALEIRATPTFVVGNEMVPGAVDLEKLEALVAQAGSAGKTRAAVK